MDEKDGASARLPTIAPGDLESVAGIILSLHAPENAGNPELSKALETQLREIQKTDLAWGLPEALLQHPNPIVRFFGAQTAQVKISRDWDSLPAELRPVVLDQILGLTGQAASSSSTYAAENTVVLRKLFSCLSGLILRLTPNKFPDPLVRVITTLAGHGASRLVIFNWLEIVISDLRRSALVEPRKTEIHNAIRQETPIVVKAIIDGLSARGNEKELEAGFKCLEAWIDWGLDAEHLAEILPVLYAHLHGTENVEEAGSAICEVLTASVYKDGKATKLLTEPLLEWFAGPGTSIVSQAVADQDDSSPDVIAVSLLCEALVDHSASWMASRMDDHRVQAFLNVLLELTGFPGTGGVDEELSSRTLGTFALLQEAIVDAPEFQTAYDSSPAWNIAKHFFREATRRVQRKIRYPDSYEGWNAEQRELFEVYRKDAGEIMVTGFYIVRDKLLEDLVESLATVLQPGAASSWQDVEATIQCIRFCSEAVPLGEDRYLTRVFNNEIFSRLPADNQGKVALSALSLIRAYEEWFRFHPSNVVFALDLTVNGLDDPRTASIAASALKALCDLCRGALTAHVSSFGALHAKIVDMQPELQEQVIEGICSVLQALPAMESIEPVITIAGPIVSKWESCVTAAHQIPEPARILCMRQIEALTACAEGLTPSDEDMFDLEPEETAGTVNAMENARQTTSVATLRERIVSTLSGTLEIWSQDAEMQTTVSAFMKAMTAPATSQTLITLPIQPLLGFVGAAAQRKSTAIWPSIAATLVFRMAPDQTFIRRNQSQEVLEREAAAKEAAISTVAQTLHSLTAVIAPLLLAKPEGRVELAETYFRFASAVVGKFPMAFVQNPHETQAGCMRIAILKLNAGGLFALRYAIELLSGILYTSRQSPSVADAFQPIILAFGHDMLRAIIHGASINSPRSSIPNYAELLVALVTRMPNETRTWLGNIMADPAFPGGQSTPAAKKRFQDAILRIRTSKKMKEALNEYALVCRGLDGTTYGNAVII